MKGCFADVSEGPTVSVFGTKRLNRDLAPIFIVLVACNVGIDW
jgi:hypothetical protein